MGHISFWPMLLTQDLLDTNINTTKKNNEALLNARKEDGLQANEEKTV